MRPWRNRSKVGHILEETILLVGAITPGAGDSHVRQRVWVGGDIGGRVQIARSKQRRLKWWVMCGARLNGRPRTCMPNYILQLIVACNHEACTKPTSIACIDGGFERGACGWRVGSL